MIKIGSHCIGQDGRVVELVSEIRKASCMGCAYADSATGFSACLCNQLYPLENRRGSGYPLDCHTNKGIFIEVTHDE